MAITRIIGHSAAVVFAVSSTLAGCSSVETANETKLSTTKTAAPTQAAEQPSTEVANTGAHTPSDQQTVTLIKTGRIPVPPTQTVAQAQSAAMAAPEMAPLVALVPTEETSAPAVQSAAAAPAASAKTSRIAQAVADGTISPTAAQAVAPDEEELTPDMVALQTAIPTPRPATTTLAYAAQPNAAAATLAVLENPKNFPPAPGDPLPATATASPPELSKLIRQYAGMYGVPESLVHRVVHRESRYNPKAHHKNGYWGLMQISYPTAKSMGYEGPPQGLLDAETNLKYAVKYLRGAWLVAENSNDNAIRLYARGYYYDAKRRGMLHVLEK